MGHKAVDEPTGRRWRPGGASNPGRGAAQWLSYYTWLVRVDERTLATSVAGNGGQTAEMERQLVDVVRGAPRRVELVSPWPGDIKSVLVYPKSITALMEADRWDGEIHTLGPWCNALEGRQSATDRELRVKALDRLQTAQAALLWLATEGLEGATAACPYAPELLADIEVPRRFFEADPYDIVRIMRAYADVNAGRLALVGALTRLKFPGLPSQDHRPSWATFTSEQALATGIPAAELADRWPLTALVAQAALRGIADHERHERAKAEAEANRPTR